MSPNAERDGNPSPNWLLGLAISLPFGVALGMAMHSATLGVLFTVLLTPAFAQAFKRPGVGPADAKDSDES
jgi:hypothetical protein